MLGGFDMTFSKGEGRGDLFKGANSLDKFDLEYDNFDSLSSNLFYMNQ